MIDDKRCLSHINLKTIPTGFLNQRIHGPEGLCTCHPDALFSLIAKLGVKMGIFCSEQNFMVLPISYFPYHGTYCVRIFFQKSKDL